MSAKQITETFHALLQHAGRSGGNNEQPRREPDPPPEPINYKELLDPNSENFNPEKAFGSYVQQNYGSLIGDINKRSVKGMFGNYRTQFHDFGDYEADIEKALESRDPATISDKDIAGTYYALKGYRATMKERAERQNSSTHKPSPPGQEPNPNDTTLDDTERGVAKVMFGHESDPEAAYKKWKAVSEQGPHELKVPLGGGKVG